MIVEKGDSTMTENDRPLPTPPRSRFGRDAQENDAPAAGMISDRMALAAAEGRLEEFLQHEIPAGDHARNLAMMMMGMSGMLPTEPTGQPLSTPPSPVPAPAAAEGQAAVEVPPEVLAAIEQGDVKNLMNVLRAEHAKRAGSEEAGTPPFAQHDPAPPVPAPTPAGAATPGSPAGIDVALIDELLKISTANDVTMDWLMLRAVKLYVQEYQKTGRL
jgi:hypothetical protein